MRNRFLAASLVSLVSSGLAGCNADPAAAWAGEFSGNVELTRSTTDTSGGSPSTTTDDATHPALARIVGSKSKSGAIVLLWEGDTCELVFDISGSNATLATGTQCSYPTNDKTTHMASGTSNSVSTDVGTDVRTYSKGSIQLGSNDAIEVTLSASFTTTDTYTGSSGTPDIVSSTGTYELDFRGQRL